MVYCPNHHKYINGLKAKAKHHNDELCTYPNLYGYVKLYKQTKYRGIQARNPSNKNTSLKNLYISKREKHKRSNHRTNLMKKGLL